MQQLFYVFGSLAVASGLLMVLQRNPITAAMNLVVTMFSLAALFVLLSAHFIAVIQLLVYAGAIMVLFIFVIMLLNLQDDELRPRGRNFIHLVSVAVVLFAMAQLWQLLSRTPAIPLAPVDEAYGTTGEMGMLLFSDYLFPFEIVSILILAAIVGAVVLAKRRLD
ncbi:MAG: NADH-quinone oxidoreductase subunit J [Deltaproteobacteria bacterium]|nr:NADH-quinone oxidoreductase subunit J [Deltaproteobacteria bacterium]